MPDIGSPAPDPAYGVFDTLLVRAGVPVDLLAHSGRLCRSVAELYDAPVDPARLAARIRADVEGLTTGRVRTSFEPATGEWVVEVEEIEEPGLDPRTLALRRLRDGWGQHKWVDRRLVADLGTAGDVLLVDDDDQVLECGSANLFAVMADTAVTPPLDGRILPGTVRTRVLALLARDGRSANERVLTLEDLAKASEVFTTSSIRGVQPVVGCAEIGAWNVGPTTMWLRDQDAAGHL